MPFAEVLRAKLGAGLENDPPRPPSTPAPMTPPLFAGGADWPTRRRGGYSSTSAPADRPARRGRPVAALTREARRALTELNDLGAGLDDTVSPADVRTAFRRLARRYHPDRHPGCDHLELARLAHLFTRMTGLARELAAALDTPTRH